MDQRLLRPGFAGELADDELQFVREHLLKDKALSRRWGFKPGNKRRPEDAIRLVAMEGSLENGTVNRQLVRGRPAKQATICDEGCESNRESEATMHRGIESGMAANRAWSDKSQSAQGRLMDALVGV